MKILVISDYRDYVSSKSEAAFLIGLQKLGAEVEVLTYPGCLLSGEMRCRGIRVRHFHPEKKWSEKEAAFVRKHLIEGKFDILQLFNSRAICTGLRAARGLPVKVVLYRGFIGNLHWWSPVDYTKYLHPRVDGIFCPAEAGVSYLRKQCVFVRPKLSYIPKGHDLGWYERVKPIERTSLGVPENAFMLVNVANARRMKGTPVLLEAMAGIPPDRPVHLVLVGRGLDKKKTRALLKKLPRPERVHFTGFRQDAWRIIRAADALVLPSIYGEAMSKAVVEAMAMNVPVVLTDIPGNVELIEHGRSGLVVPRKNPDALREAIFRYMDDPERRTSCAREARERIRTQFNTERTAAALYAFYSELLPPANGIEKLDVLCGHPA